jgi:DNA polymerase
MDYNSHISKDQIAKVSAEVIRRHRQGASDKECADLIDAFIILSKYLNKYDTKECYKEIPCTTSEFNTLNLVATGYPNTLETWGELITLDDPMLVRRNVKLCNGFSSMCDAIAAGLSNSNYEAGRKTIKVLNIDIETYSSNDISSCGVYKYAEADDFAILLFAFACDNGPAQIVDLASGEEIPSYIIDALSDSAVLKTAFNANFERTCINAFLGIDLPIEQWECTMIHCAMTGLPFSLDQVSKVLNLNEQKMQEGKSLVRYFSVPCKPTKAKGGRTRNLPKHAPDKWEVFKQYCIRDVEVERAIRTKLSAFQVPEIEKQLYFIDQRINDRGVLLDMNFVHSAMQLDNTYKSRLSEEAIRLTGLSNPNSTAQLRAWLEEQSGSEVSSLRKTDIPGLIDSADNDTVKRLLHLRQEMSKTSVKKYKAMSDVVCEDSRVRGLLQFYGASRTGRWAGRLVQVHNLPQNHLPDLDTARNLVIDKDLDTLEMLFGNVSDTLSQLIRTAFIAKPGHTLIVCDFSAIEARVIAWLAGEQWRLEVFKTHGKIYEASAAKMFHVPVDEITKTDPRRQKGKIAELALGYQGGVEALRSMGGEKMGLSEDEMRDIVQTWRNSNKAITSLWDEVQEAAMTCINSRKPAIIRKGLKLCMKFGALMIGLPSGRWLSYPRPEIGANRFGKGSITYEGQNQTTKQWLRMDTYGGKLVENIVQAIARDCLAVAIMRVEAAGYPIVFHVHDEVVIEARTDGSQSLDEVEAIFKTPVPWAKDLPLKGAGYTTGYYLKD